MVRYQFRLKRLKRSVGEMLDEFRIASGRKIDYEFINPSAGKDAKQRETQYQALVKKGLIPIDFRLVMLKEDQHRRLFSRE